MSAPAFDRSSTAADAPARSRVLFLALTNNMGCERVIGEVAFHGADCAVLSPPGFYCTRTRFAHRRFTLPPQLDMWLANTVVHTALEILARSWRPDLVVPLDDVAASILRGLAVSRRCSGVLRAALVRSLGDVRGYSASASRAGFQQMADRIGVRIPASRSVASAGEALQAVSGWSWPVVVKVEGTCGGCGVSLAPDPARLGAAVTSGLGRNSRLRRFKSRMKRLVWLAAGHFQTASAGVQVQRYVHGRPAMRTVACWQGQELDGISFLAECVHPAPSGPSSVIRPLDHKEMAVASQRLVAALGASGIVSFDFVIEDGTEHAYAIEMNPRPIGATHLGRLCGHDVCGALLRRLGWPTAASSLDLAPMPSAIAVFPKELERNPDSDWLSREGVLHDVPWDDPGLIGAYLDRLSEVHPGETPAIRRQLAATPPRIGGVGSREGLDPTYVPH